MPIHGNAANTNPEGGVGVKPGDYHVVIERAEIESNDRGDSLVTSFVIQAGTDSSQVGKSHKEYFGIGEKQISRIFELACAAGTLDRNQWREAAKSGRDIQIDEQELVGRQLIVGIRTEEQLDANKQPTGKSYSRIGFRMYSLHDERPDAAKIVRETPKHPALLAMLPPPPHAAATGSPQSATAPTGAPVGAPVAGTQAASADKWANI